MTLGQCTNRRMLGAVFVALAIAAATMATVLAQVTQTSGIAGVVKDVTGAVLPGVTVEAGGSALIEKVRTVVSDDQGQYKVINLPPGTYTVTFTLPGFGM